ncbi:MAG: class I adenylate-forming enzyme family protein [Acidimicrobiales bacterium]
MNRAQRPATAAVVHDTTVASILEDAARAAPTMTALVAGERRWNYVQLLAEARRTAGELAKHLEPGSRVAVCAPALAESLVLSYAVALAGLVLVPVNPALRSSELRHVLGDSGASALFHVAMHRDNDVGAAVDALRPQLPALDLVVDLALWDEFLADAPLLPAPLAITSDARGPDPDDVAQIVYTSGTTGAPKGAQLTHRGMTNAARFGAERFTMTRGDVYVQTMPLFHVGGQVVCFGICQQLATCVLMPAFDAGSMLELVEREGATLTCGVPTMLLSMLEHPDFSRRDLSSLRAVSSGGAVVPETLIHELEAALQIRFAIVFGQTEACGFISQTELDDCDEVKAASLGRPLPGIEARVVDDEGAVVGTGEVGELEIRGPNVMTGYHGMPEASAQALGGGWLRTGDLVDMDDDGVLRMRGRRKDMIVTGAENVFPLEVEDVLTSHPSVAQAAVLGAPDPKWGEAVVAFVRLAPGVEIETAALGSFARERLAPFKVPKRFHVVDEMPMTASGKVQKFVLRRQLDGSGESAGGAAGESAGGAAGESAGGAAPA